MINLQQILSRLIIHTSCFFSQMIIHPDNSANQQLEQHSQCSDNILWCSQAQPAQLSDGWAMQQLSMAVTGCGMIKHPAGKPGAPVPKEAKLPVNWCFLASSLLLLALK